MKITKKNSLLFGLFFILTIGLVFATGTHTKIHQSFIDWLGNVDREFYNKMQSIKVGMSKEDVIKILGAPDEISEEKEVVQTHGKFGSGQNYGTKIINKNICLIYYHGNDISAHYFIDENDKVYFLNVGGT